ncbi:MAG TPA: alpha/beta fold hydrolase [Gemmatimonadaceae bacterium]|nr:alpha/beta fold hydrolase [Gemmatimonadaceae bacterium]
MSLVAFLWRAAVALIAVGIFVPARLGTLGSRPHPAATYADGATRMLRRELADDSVVAPGGRSLFLTHGARTPRVVVLFHGFTNAPSQFRLFAEQLYADGDNVYVPRLPDHGEIGGDADSLAHLTAEELRDCADSAVDAAAGVGDSVIVVGFSTGGTLAAWIAQHRSDVRRAVIIAPALELANMPSVFDIPLVNLSLLAPNVTHHAPRDSTAPDQEPGFSSHAVAEMLRLGLAVEDAASHEQPRAGSMVFLLNPNDHTVKAGAAYDLAQHWSDEGAAVQVYQLPDSMHLPHDVVDVREPAGRTAAVYPVFMALTRGVAPPSWVSNQSARLGIPRDINQTPRGP